MKTSDILDRLPPFRKVALLSGIGAAGYLAFRMYAYGNAEAVTWRTWLIPQSCSFLPASWIDYLSPLKLTDSSADSHQEQEEKAEMERVKRHFETTVEWADEYHSEMLETISAKLFDADRLDELSRQLCPQGPAQEAQTEKVKVAAFTRFVAAIWSLPTTFILCRLVFCIFARLIYLSKAAESIHIARRNEHMDEPCPPLFSDIYQRRLLHIFKTSIQDTISHRLFGIVADVVSKHVSPIRSDQLITHRRMNEVLSAINTEIEEKIKRQGDFWTSLLGEPSPFRRHAPVSHSPGLDDQSTYIDDILREAHDVTSLRSFNMIIVEVVKVFVQRQSAFMHDAYTSVMEEMYRAAQSDGHDPSSESDNEEGTDVIEAGSSAFHRARRNEEGTVVYNEDAGSERSDYSRSSAVYDAPVNDHHSYGGDSRMSTLGSGSRLLAEPSLEPLEYSEDDLDDPFEEPADFYSDEEDNVNHRKENGLHDSELDTGEHQSFDANDSPQRTRNPLPTHVPLPQSSYRRKPIQKPLPQGIYFFRWATKLGRRGKELLTDSMLCTQEFTSMSRVHDISMCWFAPESLTIHARRRDSTTRRSRLRT